MSKRLSRLAGLSCAFLVGVILGWAVLPQPIGPVVNPERFSRIAATSTASVLIDYDDGRVDTYANLPVAAGQTVGQLMAGLQEQKNLGLQTQDFGGDLGVLVKGIGGVSNDAAKNRFWHYWVNQRFAQIGVSQYKVEPGDQVMWKYTSDQFRAEVK